MENAPYFLFDTVVGEEIAVCFEPLTEADHPALESEDWRGARFLDVWKESIGHDIALKLTLCEGEDKSLFGILRLGNTLRTSGHAGALKGSLLETAPVYRHSMTGRRYHGIGRVLVARLVMESKAQGAAGRLRIRAARDSEAFYEKLGFIRTRETAIFVLEANKAEELLRLCRH